MDPPLGTVVVVPQGRGVVRFSGATAFSTGRWVGIELDEQNGKNDGSVNGVPYFSCKMGFGVFVRQSQIKSYHGLESDAGPSTRPIPAPTRPQGHQRTPSTGALLRTNSIRTPPSSNASPRSASPAKPVVPQPPPTILRIARQTNASPTKRPQISLQPRKSIARQSPSLDSPVPPSPKGEDVPTRKSSGLSSTAFARRTSSPLAATPSEIGSPPPPPPNLLPSSLQSPILQVSNLTSLPPPPPITAVDDQELQELRAKIRVLEAKRADDARHVRQLETRLSEAESFVALKPKLQAKLTSQQTELITAKRELADAQQLAQLSDSRVLDAQEQLEMAMLDKEVAEERAEIAEAELEELKEKLAVVEVEMGVMKEGGAGDTAAGGESLEKSSLAYIQLEKQNERLKEALIRLRDISQETEQEQRRRISEMEKDIIGVDDLQSQYESSLIKLTNAETQVEDLKMQLDDALGAEEMLVQLTERNLMLGEKIEEMRITIEDLEALKELNDELEENHVETEKSLHEEIDAKDMQIREHLRRVQSLEESCQDLEGTIGQFRELVMQLQTDLDNLRAQTQTAQTESATAASQSAAMMSLNLKLQSSASKNQARNIELEMKRLEAREARELLGIVQPYLPQIYVESDSDATSCYLFFLRLAYKADLINTVVAQAHGLPESLNGSVSEVLVGVCEMRGRISGLSILCKRFAAVLRRCDVESFLNFGRLYPELSPMEKRIDLHIGLLRRDEFRERECVSDIVKIQAQFDHLAETYFDGFDHDLGERELGYVMSLDHDLDMFAASIGLTKTSITSIIQDEEAVLDMGGYDIDNELFEPLQGILEQCKGAKGLSKKLTRRLEDLIHDSTALKSHLIPQMKGLSNMVAELVNFGISLAQEFMSHPNDARGPKTFQLTAALTTLKQIASSTVAKDMKPGGSVWEAIGQYISQLTQEGSKLLPLALEPENVLKVTGVAPWVTRVQEVKASLAINVEAERKVAQLNDEMQGLMRSLKTKDQGLQESSVKIELMERRMEAVKKQADAITTLEAELAKARKQERTYEDAIEHLHTELDALTQDNTKLKTMAVGQERPVQGQPSVETENVQVEGSLETSHLLEQLEALRGTVRFLRNENSYLKGQDLLREIEALPPLPKPITIAREQTPPLDPTTPSDSESEDADLPRTPPTLRSLATETKLLYRDVIKFSASPRVVDLSVIQAKRAEAKNGKIWMPKKEMPAHQVWERKEKAERLNKRVQGLLNRTSAIKVG